MEGLTTAQVPQRESEAQREFGKLRDNTESIEKLTQVLTDRLQPFLCISGKLSQTDDAKIPENSSKFAQEFNSINGRLINVARNLDELLGRLEI